MDKLGLGTFLIFIGFGGWWITKQFRRHRKQRERTREAFFKAYRTGFSLDIRDYELHPKGKRRSHSRERLFKRKYLFDLLEVYDHQCAHCERNEVKLELDHFFIPKSLGGDLMVLHRDGYWVCNGILLCRNCNKKKADTLPKDFFSKAKLKEILEKNREMSLVINSYSKDLPCYETLGK